MTASDDNIRERTNEEPRQKQKKFPANKSGMKRTRTDMSEMMSEMFEIACNWPSNDLFHRALKLSKLHRETQDKNKLPANESGMKRTRRDIGDILEEKKRSGLTLSDVLCETERAHRLKRMLKDLSLNNDEGPNEGTYELKTESDPMESDSK